MRWTAQPPPGRVTRSLIVAPRLVADYGPGTWFKMQCVLRGAGNQFTVHDFRNLTSSLDVEYTLK